MRTRSGWPAGLALLALVTAGCRTAQPAVPSSADATGSDRPVMPTPLFGEPAVLGHLHDPAIGESSGLVAGRANPGLLWTHNDSGDGPFAYCLQATGASCGTWRVTGAEARDWEDAAAGPGPDPARSYLYFGDIGDNDLERAEVVVYRVPEPAVPPEAAAPGRDAARATEPAEVFRLRYPDGAHDAEALLVHPTTGDLFVVAKEASTTPAVYRAAAPLRPGEAREMTRVPGLRLPGFTARLELVTGGDISPDGRRVVLSTYAAGYELELPAGDAAFDDIWRRPATSIALAPRRQGEAIAYRLDGAAVLATSEGVGAAVTQVERHPATARP
ncbi:MAG TPA: hypothetical protein VM264_10250 [Acidimicrobiales bacterium]|nr:hypothetical protein [Acidimicrobiales bacterium]